LFGYKIDDTLKLRILELRHAEPLYNVVRANQQHIGKWLRWANESYSLENAKSYITVGLNKFVANEGFRCGIWLNNELVGCVGLNRINWRSHYSPIGYWMAQEQQGKGIMTRSVKALIDYTFAEIGLNRLEIYCATENKRSRAVPERLGFSLEGILREADWLGDHFADIALYSMLASEWPRS